MAIQIFARSSKQLGRALARCQERANLILPIFSGEGLTGYAAEADELTGGLISRRIEQDGFEPKVKKYQVIDTDLSTDGLDKIILVGLGARSKLTVSRLRRALVEGFEAARDTARSEHIVFPLVDVDLKGLIIEVFAEVVAQYAILMDYELNHQKTREDDDAPTHLKTLTLLTTDWALSAVKRGIRSGQVSGEATCRARDLVNEPSDTCTPQRLARFAREIAANSGGLITCTVLGKKEVTKLGMGGLLGVNRGSADGCMLIDLTYTPPCCATEEVIGLVGKGITFDSGGLSIKDTASMRDMKNDMGGAAAVLCTMQALTVLKPKVSVRAIVAATDNLVDAKSVRPGDILKMMSGLTVEVQDTDAEGRLTLADALHYVQEKGGAVKIIDLATLTGSVEEALGANVTGVFGNNPKFTSEFLKCARRAGEEMWELPLPEIYRENNKSTMADLTNDGSGPGAIAAAWFLREFIRDGVSWVHCDIAGTSYLTNACGVDPEGATGAGVRTLLEFLYQYR